jgi:hypothetical protein
MVSPLRVTSAVAIFLVLQVREEDYMSITNPGLIFYILVAIHRNYQFTKVIGLQRQRRSLAQSEVEI